MFAVLIDTPQNINGLHKKIGTVFPYMFTLAEYQDITGSQIPHPKADYIEFEQNGMIARG